MFTLIYSSCVNNHVCWFIRRILWSQLYYSSNFKWPVHFSSANFHHFKIIYTFYPDDHAVNPKIELSLPAPEIDGYTLIPCGMGNSSDKATTLLESFKLMLVLLFNDWNTLTKGVSLPCIFLPFFKTIIYHNHGNRNITALVL